jgi:hypothetical protein
MNRLPLVIAVVALVVLAMHVAAPCLPEQDAWGLWPYTVFDPHLGFILAVVVASLVLPAVNEAVRRALAKAFRLWPTSFSKTLAFALVSLAAIVPFWLLRIRHDRWGDAALFVVALPYGLVYNWQAPMDVFLHAKAWTLANRLWGWDVATTYAVISVAMGAVFVFVLFHLADLLGRDVLEKAIVFGLFVSLGTMQLFFGYIESYTIIPVGILLYLFLSLRYLQGRTSLTWPALALGATMAFHPSTGSLGPSLLVLYLARWRERPDWRAHVVEFLRAALPVLAMVAMVVVILSLGQHGIDALLGADFPGGGDRRWFVPLFKTETEYEHYTMFSLGHLIDFVNEHLLIAPLGLILIAAILVLGWRGIDFRDPMFCFLLVASFFYLLFTTTWNPDYGGRKDWDLFASVSLPYTLLGAYLLTRCVKDRAALGYIGLVVIAVSLLHTMAWIISNAVWV